MITLIMRLWVSTEKQQRRGERESNLIWTEEFLPKGIREICRPKEEPENKGIIEGKCLKRRVACKHHWNKRLNKTRSILLDLYFKGFVHFHWEMIKTGDWNVYIPTALALGKRSEQTCRQQTDRKTWWWRQTTLDIWFWSAASFCQLVLIYRALQGRAPCLGLTDLGSVCIHPSVIVMVMRGALIWVKEFGCLFGSSKSGVLGWKVLLL